MTYSFRRSMLIFRDVMATERSPVLKNVGADSYARLTRALKLDDFPISVHI